jgi:hypothetical protein
MKKRIRKGYEESRVMGLYHSMKNMAFACLVHLAPMTEAPTWRLIHGGTKVPGVEANMLWMTFSSIQDVRAWLSENDFYPLNRNIILCPSEKYSECMSDVTFWDAISRVYGPDSASIVVYDTKKNPYRISALEKLGYHRQDVHWIWYGRDTDPAIEAWLNQQIVEEVAELGMYVAMNDFQEVYENRQIEVSRMAYEVEIDEDTGEEYKLLFQYKDGEVIEI